MSWGLAANWLTVGGLVLLTAGTGAQALTNLAEFKSLQGTLSDAVIDTARAVASAALIASPTVPSWLTKPLLRSHRAGKWMAIATLALGTIVMMPNRLKEIRAAGGDDAVQLARFARLAEVWAILMAGSALALVAAVIQLTLAYQ